MIELRLEVDRPWTVRFEDTEGRLRLHRERAALLQELVATVGLVVRDWGEALADYPRESVTVEVDAPSDEAVREVVRTAVRWLRSGAVKDIRIGVAGQAPVNAAAIDLPRLPSVTRTVDGGQTVLHDGVTISGGIVVGGGQRAKPPAPRPPAPMAAPAPDEAAAAARPPAPAAARPSTAAEARPPGWTSARPPDHHPDLYAGPPPAPVMAPPSRGRGRAAPTRLLGGIVGGIVRGIRGLRPSGDLRRAEMAAEPAAEPAGAAPHVAYGLLRGPAEAVALEPFDLEVGLSKLPAAGVAGPALNLPPVEAEPYDVDVRIAASGFTFPPDQPQRLTLKVSSAHPYPVVHVRLIPKRPREGAVDRHITAEYSIGGERLGDAIRSIRVLPTSDLRTRPVAERVETGVNVLAPTGTEKADLTLTVRKADKPGFVDWTIDSPHTDVVTPNRKPISTEVEDAGDYLRNLIQQIDAAEGSEGVFDDVLALAYRVGRSVPDDVWKAIRAVAAKRGGPPTILLVSEEAYIPWELAQVDPPLLPGSTLPPFLAAQSRIGRWVQATEEVDGRTRPSPNPPRRKDVASLGVVWGSYARTSWTNLANAKKEAKELSTLYGGQAIEPTNRAMYDLLRGTPAADLLHFAVHGRYNPENPGAESGIILTDGKSLHANEIAPHDLKSSPVVFLNACQLGAGQLELGAYSGVAAAFVEAGASAVIAPLWKIDDDLARQIALDFYEQVAKGETLSEVLRRAREPFVEKFETKSATWMAYQLFGHPSFVVGGLKAR